MLQGRDIVLISSVDWSFLWQVPQEITLRLARAGNRLLYVENTGVRAPALRDLGRMKTRLLRRLKTWHTGGVRQFSQNVTICSPLILPPFGSAWRGRLNRHLFLPQVARSARRLGMRDPLIWTFLPTDSACEIIRALRTQRSAVIYHCCADFARLTPDADGLRRSERKLLEQSDVVFATCAELIRHCRAFNPNVHACPNGIDLSAFPLEEDDPRPGRMSPAVETYRRLLSSLPRPIIGYVGGLHRFVDLGLVAEMARARPGWSWVFVGPHQVSAAAIAGLPNVHLLGQQPHDELVHYIRTFDVGIVPYLNNIHTRTVVPVKINEYLAVGKPVVSTDLPPVLEFNRAHGVLATSDQAPAGFLGAIELALRTARDEETIARRREVATQNDWQGRLQEMCSLIEPRLR